MRNFTEIRPEALDRNIFELIGKNWMLITAKDESKETGANAMTASWGGAGILWGKPVCTVFIRPQRYTYSLIEKSDRLSLCFPSETYRDALKVCGSRSGRDGDKIKDCDLTVFTESNTPCIAESDLIIICRKLYADDIKEDCFIDKAPLSNYAAGDFHRYYICEIEKILKAVE